MSERMKGWVAASDVGSDFCLPFSLLRLKLVFLKKKKKTPRRILGEKTWISVMQLRCHGNVPRKRHIRRQMLWWVRKQTEGGTFFGSDLSELLSVCLWSRFIYSTVLFIVKGAMFVYSKPEWNWFLLFCMCVLFSQTVILLLYTVLVVNVHNNTVNIHSLSRLLGTASIWSFSYIS